MLNDLATGVTQMYLEGDDHETIDISGCRFAPENKKKKN